MNRSRDEAGALRRMVEELRAEPTPELDWDALEQKVLARVARSEAPRLLPRPKPSPLRRMIALGAVAATVGLLVGRGERAEHVEAPAPVSSERALSRMPAAPAGLEGGPAIAGDLDRRALREADLIEAETGPVSFVESGVVRWTLSAGGRVLVKKTGPLGGVVSLERGWLRAEVVPRDPSEGLVEAFAVEAGKTRVAVHGTAFTVFRQENEVVVDVEHGTVAVGPAGHVGATTGRILVGPARASFSFDGGRLAQLLPAQEAANDERVPGLSTSAPAPSAPEAAEAPASVARPQAQPIPPAGSAAAKEVPASEPGDESAPSAVEPPAPVFLTEGVVRAQIQSCLAGIPGILKEGVSVVSTLQLTLRADGTIQSGRFDPPLKPELQQCAVSILGGRFEQGGRVIRVPITFSP